MSRLRRVEELARMLDNVAPDGGSTERVNGYLMRGEVILCPVCDFRPVAERTLWVRDQMVCERCHEAWARSPEGLAARQTFDAERAIDRDAAEFLVWPWPELARITTPMMPGQVYYWAAFSGNGKTTMAWSAAMEWARRGIPGYVCSLETVPHEWRVGLACTAVGVNPSYALTGMLRAAEQAGDPKAKVERAAIRAELERQRTDWADVLHVSPVRDVTAEVLEREAEKAADLGARWMLVDHIDHVTPENYTQLASESQFANKAALKAGQRHGLIMLLASQLNMEIVRANRLAKFSPPQEHHLLYPGVKNHVAASILGLWRPLDPGADPQMMKDAIKGDLDPYALVKPDRVAVLVMKLRHQLGDAHVGARCELRSAHGRFTSIEDWQASWEPPPGPPPVHNLHPDRALRVVRDNDQAA